MFDVSCSFEVHALSQVRLLNVLLTSMLQVSYKLEGTIIRKLETARL